jgi:ATP-binding cassette, subfamily A (ABC1), member 3
MVMIIQSFFIQVFLSRAKIGVVIALLFFLIQYIISFLSSDTATTLVNSAISIIPHAAFTLAFKTMLFADSYQIALTFGDILNNYAIGVAFGSFIFNALFYLLLTWYLDQVFPN